MEHLPFSALFTYASGKVRGNLTPGLSPVLFHAGHKDAVLFFSPWSFDHFRIKNFLPAMQALYIGAILELLGNFLPIFRLTRAEAKKKSIKNTVKVALTPILVTRSRSFLSCAQIIRRLDKTSL